MKFMDLFQTANASLWRSKTRTFLTVTAIFIGAMTITLTNGIGTGIKTYLNQQVSGLGSKNVMQIFPSGGSAKPRSQSDSPAAYDPNRKVSNMGMTLMSTKDIAAIESTPNITDAQPAYMPAPDYIMGKGGKYQLSNIAEQLGDSTAATVAGKNVDDASLGNQIVLPDSYVSSMGYGSAQALVGQQVSIGITNALGEQSAITATVTGVRPKMLIESNTAAINPALAKNLSTAQSVGLPAASSNQYSMVLAVFPSNLTASQITALEQALKAKGYDVQTLQDAENTVFTVIDVVIIVLDVFAGITLLAASFGIVNTLYMAVQERTKEIGLMKALGMSRRKIFALFSIEAALLGFWGSVLGVGVAAALGKVINAIATNGFLKGIPGLTLLTFPVSTVAVVVLGIMLIAFLAGTLPALRASRKDPIEALRYE